MFCLFLKHDVSFKMEARESQPEITHLNLLHCFAKKDGILQSFCDTQSHVTVLRNTKKSLARKMCSTWPFQSKHSCNARFTKQQQKAQASRMLVKQLLDYKMCNTHRQSVMQYKANPYILNRVYTGDYAAQPALDTSCLAQLLFPLAWTCIVTSLLMRRLKVTITLIFSSHH